MDTAEAYSTPLPVAWYREPDPFQAERHGLFAHTWMAFTPATVLQDEGAYVCSNLAGWPLFAWRDAAGILRAYHNICRHQKMPMLQAGGGVLEELRCPFHGWIYGQDGRLKEAKPPVVPDVEDLSTIRLNQMTVTPWKGMLFVAVGEEPLSSDVEQTLAGIDDRMPDLNAGWDYAGTDSVDLICNWKTYLDFGGALETPAGCPAAAIEAAAVAAETPADNLVIIEGIGGGMWLWALPTLGVYIAEDTVVISQLVARTMIRSRLERHVFVRPNIDSAGALAAWKAVGVQSKQMAESAHKALAAATEPDASSAQPTPSPARFGLHDRVRSILEV